MKPLQKIMILYLKEYGWTPDSVYPERNFRNGDKTAFVEQSNTSFFYKGHNIGEIGNSHILEGRNILLKIFIEGEKMEPRKYDDELFPL